MYLLVKAHATKPGGLSRIWESYMVEKNQLLLSCLLMPTSVP